MENPSNKVASNYSKKSLKNFFFVSVNFLKNFHEYIRMETQALRMKILREKY